jgi:hypothetical protein
MASDTKYTDTVAKQMLRRTHEVSTEWTGHVAQTGVTCQTCHRGNAVPEGTWFVPTTISRCGTTSIVRTSACRPTRRSAARATTSRAFANWEQSPPQRLTALRGTRMVRDQMPTQVSLIP